VKVLADTNLLISALLYLKSVPSRALLHAAKNYDLILSDYNIAELRRVAEFPTTWSCLLWKALNRPLSVKLPDTVIYLYKLQNMESVEAVCIDMREPYKNAADSAFPNADAWIPFTQQKMPPKP
jgi:predicted nucleic acid-binding protein